MSIYSTLAADTTVTAIVGTSIFVSQAEDNTSAPYIVIDFVGIVPLNYVKGAPDAESQRADIKCIGISQKQSIDLYKLVRDSLVDTGQELLVSSYGEYDEVTSKYFTSFDFSCFQHR